MLTGEMTDSRARVAHVGIAVPSIAHALGFYRAILGLQPGQPESADGATIVRLTLGDVQVELLEPRDAESPVANVLGRGGRPILDIRHRLPDLDRTVEPARASGHPLADQ